MFGRSGGKVKGIAEEGMGGTEFLTFYDCRKKFAKLYVRGKSIRWHFDFKEVLNSRKNMQTFIKSIFYVLKFAFLIIQKWRFKKVKKL